MKKTYKLEMSPEAMAVIDHFLGMPYMVGAAWALTAQQEALVSISGAMEQAARVFTPLDEVPEACPCCGFEDAHMDWFTTAQDSTLYNGSDTEFHDGHTQGENPEEQQIRLYCSSCSEYLPLSDKLAKRIQDGESIGR